MRQEINLLPIIKKAPLPVLSFSMAVIISIFLILLLTAITWQGKNHLESIVDTIKEMEKKQNKEQKQTINADDIKRKKIYAKKLENTLFDKNQLWNNYSSIISNGKRGFSRHFYYISQFSGNDLSLYEIDIYNRGHNLALKGFSRKAKHIPIYINQLKKQEEFKAMDFGDLLIEKVKNKNIMHFSLEKMKVKSMQDVIESMENIPEVIR